MFDILIKNGFICDGSGEPGYYADIGIKGDRIAYIGTEPEADGRRVLDASGKTVTPGFIDPHTHVDLSVLAAPEMEPYLKQGVTTVVTGNCGYGMAPQGKDIFYCSDMNERFLALAGAKAEDPLPLFFDKEAAGKALEVCYGVKADWITFDDFNRRCSSLPLGCNIAPLLGYSAARTAVMGRDCLREADEEEMQALEKTVRSAMESGAFGISTGRDPVYLPGPYASDEEMRRMVKTVADCGGIFASHTYNRNREGIPDRIGGYKEQLRQAAGSGVKVHISHVHVMGMAETSEEGTEAARRTLAFFRKMREEGADLTYDVIPSPSSADYTQVSMGYFLKPLILMTESRSALAEQWRELSFRKNIYRRIRAGELPSLDEENEVCMLGELCILKHKNPAYIGKFVVQCAEEMNAGILDTVMELFSEDPDMAADYASQEFEEAVDLLCGSDYAMPCSDGSSYPGEMNLTGHSQMPLYPNSMNIGYIPRYLGRYGNEHFEKAVYKASGFPAERFGIADRGVIREGAFADLVVLDRKRLRSFDEDENPLKDPEGIDYVLVNGRIAAEHGTPADYAGRVLRKGE